ncbi:MAG: hypothetical protein ACRDJM_03020 [Actinomycetota bacterium]
MPVSKRKRKKRSEGAITNRTIRRATRRDWRQRVGWPLAAIGAALFIVGQVGSRTGLISLPFDRHHVISQVGGFFLAIRGLIWAWR